MDFSLSLDAKEVLLHLNYMGYRNVTAIQLKEFIGDLKKLMKYEEKQLEQEQNIPDKTKKTVNNPKVRLFDHHTVSSKLKERNVDKNKLQTKTNNEKPSELRNKNLGQKPVGDHKKQARICNEILVKNKENVPVRHHHQEQKEDKANKVQNLHPDNVGTTKMWIRPRSSQSAGRTQKRKNDPVALYQAYQKDWERFRAQICESSHSDLRWLIREKMLGNQES